MWLRIKSCINVKVLLFTCLTLFLELPTRKMPTVCRPKQQQSHISFICMKTLRKPIVSNQLYRKPKAEWNLHWPYFSRCWQQLSSTCGTCLQMGFKLSFLSLVFFSLGDSMGMDSWRASRRRVWPSSKSVMQSTDIAPLP